MKRFLMVLSLLAGVLAFGVGYPEDFPPLPGPGLEIPVDVNGDGISTFGDQYVFNAWLGMGGSLQLALAYATTGNGLLDLSEFFRSPQSALDPDAPVTFGAQSVTEVPGEAAILQGGGCEVEITRRIPPTGIPNSSSSDARITPDGQFIVFSSYASNLPESPGIGQQGYQKSQIYRAQVLVDSTIAIKLVSRDTAGNPSPDHCFRPSISNDGNLIVFDTVAVLDPSMDFNGALRDVYLRDITDPQDEQTWLMSLNYQWVAGDGPSIRASISGDGAFVVFTSSASDLEESEQCTPPCLDAVFRMKTDLTQYAARVSVSDCPNDPLPNSA
jgi:hypothetical protein